MTITGLDACTSYWVTVTVAYCSLSSEPQLLSIKDSAPYELVLLLTDTTISCSDWITENNDAKIRDIEIGLRAATSSCFNGLQTICFRESQWMCHGNNDRLLTFQ